MVIPQDLDACFHPLMTYFCLELWMLTCKLTGYVEIKLPNIVRYFKSYFFLSCANENTALCKYVYGIKYIWCRWFKLFIRFSCFFFWRNNSDIIPSDVNWTDFMTVIMTLSFKPTHWQPSNGCQDSGCIRTSLTSLCAMGLLPGAKHCVLRMQRGRFPRHRWLAIPKGIAARASRKCHDPWWDR